MRRAALALLLLASACVDDEGDLENPCGPAPDLVCGARADGPCAPATALAPVCDGAAWGCPAGSEVWPPFETAPLCEVPAEIQHVGPAIPDGGRCRLVVNGDVTGDEGRRTWAVPEGPGACPAEVEAAELFDRAQLSPVQIVDLNDVVVTPRGRLAVHRLFTRVDADPFGVAALGASVVRWPEGAPMPVPNPPQWSGHGFRSLAVDGDTVYLFDCFGAPVDLLEDCGVGRAPLDRATDPSAYAWLKTDGRFAPGLEDRQAVFRAGPQHSLTWHPGLDRWVMVSVAGFGDTVFLSTAARPEGPWSAPRDVHRCVLPDGGFCDSARLLPSLWNPADPGWAALTYRVDHLRMAGPWPAQVVRIPLEGVTR